MKRKWILFGLGVLALVWIGSENAVWPQEKTERTEAVEKQLQGFWTLVFQENDGKGMMPGLIVMLPELHKPADSSPLPRMRFWRITKNKIEFGVEEYGEFVPDSRPGARGVFELNPGNKPGTIDFFDLDKDGQKVTKSSSLGLYELKGDYLMICMNITKGGMRPDNFAISSNAKTERSVWVFRRGKLERKGSGFVVRDKD